VAVNLVLLYAGPAIFSLQPVPNDPDKTEANRNVLRTIVFNTFVMMQVFNEFNARRIDDSTCGARRHVMWCETAH